MKAERATQLGMEVSSGSCCKWHAPLFAYITWLYISLTAVNVGSMVSSQKKPDRNIDCVGLYCPEPVFRTRQALDQLAVGQVLAVVADDPAAEEDIKRLIERLGHQLLALRKDGNQVHFLIKKMK